MKSTIRTRQAAMKRFFKYTIDKRECFNHPKQDVEIFDKKYTCFTDSYSVVLTTEVPVEMKMYDETKGSYPNIKYVISENPEYITDKSQGCEKVDLSKYIAEAKESGYRLKKSAFVKPIEFLFKYKDGYFNIGLVDKAFAVIDDNEDTIMYYTNPVSPVYIHTSIGLAVIYPVRIHDGLNNHTVVEIKAKEW